MLEGRGNAWGHIVDVMIRRRVGVGSLASLLVVFGLGASGAAAPRCFGKAATMVGTTKKDRLTGTKRKDVIVANGGDDRIKPRERTISSAPGRQ
jgi:hypothetical protein